MQLNKNRRILGTSDSYVFAFALPVQFREPYPVDYFKLQDTCQAVDTVEGVTYK